MLPDVSYMVRCGSGIATAQAVGRAGRVAYNVIAGLLWIITGGEHKPPRRPEEKPKPPVEKPAPGPGPGPGPGPDPGKIVVKGPDGQDVIITTTPAPAPGPAPAPTPAPAPPTPSAVGACGSVF